MPGGGSGWSPPPPGLGFMGTPPGPIIIPDGIGNLKAVVAASADVRFAIRDDDFFHGV